MVKKRNVLFNGNCEKSYLLIFVFINRVHFIQKSIELFFKFILMSSKENDIIYDLFMGSGIIVCVCMDLNRNYIGFEILSEYCEIIKKRLS